MSEDRWSEDEVKLYEALQEKYKGNDLFERLEDVQLAICGVMDELGRGDYEIIKKNEKKELINKFIAKLMYIRNRWSSEGYDRLNKVIEEYKRLKK